MEHGGPKPRVNAYVRPSEVVWSHGMILGDTLGHHSRSLDVRNQVQDGKRDRGGLLHPSIPNKWPLPIILYNGFFLLDSFIGEESHALVLAFVGAGPLGKAKEKGSPALAFEVIQTDWDAILK